MDREEAFAKVVKIITPDVKNQAALESADDATHILDDLKVNSARLVDVVLAFEDELDIEIPDEDVDAVNTIGDCVNLILEKTG